MDVTRIHEYTDIYMEAYMRALNKTHNADLAVQVAMGVTFAVTNTLEAAGSTEAKGRSAAAGTRNQSCRTPGGDVCKCSQPAAPRRHRKRERRR